jgi:hypothetical protein
MSCVSNAEGKDEDEGEGLDDIDEDGTDEDDDDDLDNENSLDDKGDTGDEDEDDSGEDEAEDSDEDGFLVFRKTRNGLIDITSCRDVFAGAGRAAGTVTGAGDVADEDTGGTAARSC